MTAAAAAGGVLAVVVPAVAVTGGAPASFADEAAVLRLTAADDPGRASAGDAGGLRPLASIVPVADVTESTPPELEVSELLKAVGLAEIVAKAEEDRLAREAAAKCDADLGGLGRVRAWVRDGARFLSCLHDEPALIGVAARSRHSDHPSGLAVDFMTRGERGDRIAECALANQEELGITYVIWEQRVNYGEGWESMSDRGGDTANHYDHVHISFESRAPGGDPSVERCS